ncbi:MAG: hypothetical protein R3D29_14730 [Nitratireductor sp.]
MKRCIRWGECACAGGSALRCLVLWFCWQFLVAASALGISPMATATGQVTASSLTLVPLALLIDLSHGSLPFPVLRQLHVFGVAAFSTALAYLLFFRISKARSHQFHW